MRRFFIVVCITSFIFLAITMLTAQVNLPSCGNNIYGFPLTFYEVYGGKRTYYPPNYFSSLNLIINVSVAFVCSLISLFVLDKLKLYFLKNI